MTIYSGTHASVAMMINGSMREIKQGEIVSLMQEPNPGMVEPYITIDGNKMAETYPGGGVMYKLINYLNDNNIPIISLKYSNEQSAVNCVDLNIYMSPDFNEREFAEVCYNCYVGVVAVDYAHMHFNNANITYKLLVDHTKKE